MKGYVNSIETMGLVDGPGIRVVVFLESCPLRCLYCHNPEMWKFNEQSLTTSDEVFQKIMRYKTYFENNGGVTFSGGEPLIQKDFLLDMVRKCKEQGINVCLDTCGAGIEDYKDILEFTDLIIMDIKAVDPKQYLELTKRDIGGSLEFLKAVQKLDKKMWLRTVIVPGINDTYEFMDELAEFINKLKNIEKVELLAFHQMGKSKYIDLNIPYALADYDNMDKSKLLELNEYFQNKLLINK